MASVYVRSWDTPSKELHLHSWSYYNIFIPHPSVKYNKHNRRVSLHFELVATVLFLFKCFGDLEVDQELRNNYICFAYEGNQSLWAKWISSYCKVEPLLPSSLSCENKYKSKYMDSKDRDNSQQIKS